MDTKKWLQNEYVKKALYAFAVVAGAGIIILLLLNIQTIFGAITGFLGWVFAVMSGFVAGFVVAYLLLGVVVWLQNLLMKIPLLHNKPRAARGLSVAATYLLIFIVFFGVLFALAIAITKQVQTINFADLPQLVQELEVQILGFVNALIEALEKFGIATEGMKEWLSNLGTNISNSLTSVGAGFFSFANNVKSFMANALFAVIFSVYFLYDTDGLMEYWSKAFHALFGKRIHGVLAILVHDADTCFSGYIRGRGCGIYGSRGQHFIIAGRRALCGSDRHIVRDWQSDPLCRTVCGVWSDDRCVRCIRSVVNTGHCCDFGFDPADDRWQCHQPPSAVAEH